MKKKMNFFAQVTFQAKAMSGSSLSSVSMWLFILIIQYI